METNPYELIHQVGVDGTPSNEWMIEFADWDRNPHNAMEYIELAAEILPLKKAKSFVRHIVEIWKTKSTFPGETGGSAGHCLLSALVLSDNRDLTKYIPWASSRMSGVLVKESCKTGMKGYSGYERCDPKEKRHLIEVALWDWCRQVECDMEPHWQAVNKVLVVDFDAIECIAVGTGVEFSAKVLEVNYHFIKNLSDTDGIIDIKADSIRSGTVTIKPEPANWVVIEPKTGSKRLAPSLETEPTREFDSILDAAQYVIDSYRDKQPIPTGDDDLWALWQSALKKKGEGIDPDLLPDVQRESEESITIGPLTFRLYCRADDIENAYVLTAKWSDEVRNEAPSLQSSFLPDVNDSKDEPFVVALTWISGEWIDLSQCRSSWSGKELSKYDKLGYSDLSWLAEDYASFFRVRVLGGW